MRPFAVAVVSLFLVGALAGCINGTKTETPAASGSTESVTTASDKASSTASGAATTARDGVPRLPALPVTLTVSGPAWVAAGSSIPVSATATGASKFVWALGAAPEASAVKSANLNTSLIAPGASKSLKFGTAGVYAFHCHPHPYMRHNVTVIDRYTGPSQVTVKIVDGASPGEYRYSPENVVVGPGTEIVYENVGELPHTATQMGQEPPVKIVELKTSSGSVVASGEGWMRVLVIASDAAGRVGFASAPIYVTKELPTTLEETLTGTFTAPSPNEAVPLGGAGPVRKGVRIAHAGTAFLNVTATDAAGLASVSAKLVRYSTEKVAVETAPGASGAVSGEVEPGDYDLIVEPEAGVNVEFTATLTVVYALVPPPLVPEAPPADPHAGH